MQCYCAIGDGRYPFLTFSHNYLASPLPNLPTATVHRMEITQTRAFTKQTSTPFSLPYPLNTNITYGFYNHSVGQIPDKVNAIALCRGDVELDICRSCLNDSTRELRRLCPNQMEAIGWYDKCMLRYLDRSIFHSVDTLPGVYRLNPINASNVDVLNQKLNTLLDKLQGKASRGGSLRKFAADSIKGFQFTVLYGLVKCTPDVSSSKCNDCLISAARVIPVCCNGNIASSISKPSCSIRYDIQRIYNDTVTEPPSLPSPPPPRPQPPGKEEDKTTRSTAIVITGTSVIFLFVCIIIYMRRKQRKLLEKLKRKFKDELLVLLL